MSDANKENSPGGLLMPALQLAFVAAAAVLVYSFVSVAKEGELRKRCGATCIARPNYAGTDRKVPSVTFHDLKGNAVSLDSYRGKTVVLNFWTKTCGPCLEEMQSIADLTRILASRHDVAVVAVSTDDTAKEVTDTLKSILHEEAPFTVLIDPDSEIVGGRFGTHLFPETWLIDSRGVLRARFDGSREWSSPALVELVDEMRSGGYCPLDVNGPTTTGEAKSVCEGMLGG